MDWISERVMLVDQNNKRTDSKGDTWWNTWIYDDDTKQEQNDDHHNDQVCNNNHNATTEHGGFSSRSRHIHRSLRHCQSTPGHCRRHFQCSLSSSSSLLLSSSPSSSSSSSWLSPSSVPHHNSSHHRRGPTEASLPVVRIRSSSIEAGIDAMIFFLSIFSISRNYRNHHSFIFQGLHGWDPP